jgi:regulator of protease activity HflC (stomatin/prohibitin superfamily)
MNRKIVWGLIALFVVIVGLSISTKLTETVDAGEIVFIQDPIDGDIHVHKQPGTIWQGWGKATHFKKSNQFWFTLQGEKENAVDKRLSVKWNDGGTSKIEGSVRYDLPTDDKQLISLLSRFGSQDALENDLIKTNIEKAVTMTGPLMSSKESYAEKKNDLIYYIEDQASKGAYRTKQVTDKEIDPITDAEKTVTKVVIQTDNRGLPYRQEASPIYASGIRLYNISIKDMHYDKTVEDQIAAQQRAIMQVQTAIANAKRAEQDALTTAKQGEADAAKAKWEQEVIKARMVTEAESNKAVAELAVQTAELEKRKLILEGEGEAAKKRLVMQANGALEQKLQAWIESQKYWSDAFKNYQGQIVPTYQMGGPSNGSNGAQNFMDLMMMKTAKDLNLDLSNRKN